MEYIYHILILVCIYTMLAQSLNLAAGFAGQLSLAHAGFYGVGAYVTGILSTQMGLPFWGNIIIAISVNGLIAAFVALISFRTVDDYFIICTLGIQMVIYSVMINWSGLTGGPFGISNIPAIRVGSIDIDNNQRFLIIAIIFTILIWVLLNKIGKSTFGKTLIAVSEDEIYSSSIGIDVYRTKILSFTISATLAAIPGALYAHYSTYIDPSLFSLNQSILIFTIFVIGGFTNFRGSFLASFFLVVLPEILRFTGVGGNAAANLRQIIYGLLLIVVVLVSLGKTGSLFKILRKVKL